MSDVQRAAAIKFKPLSLFCRKPTGARLGVHVGTERAEEGYAPEGIHYESRKCS